MPMLMYDSRVLDSWGERALLQQPSHVFHLNSHRDLIRAVSNWRGVWYNEYSFECLAHVALVQCLQSFSKIVVGHDVSEQHLLTSLVWSLTAWIQTGNVYTASSVQELNTIMENRNKNGRRESWRVNLMLKTSCFKFSTCILYLIMIVGVNPFAYSTLIRSRVGFEPCSCLCPFLDMTCILCLLKATSTKIFCYSSR